MTTQISPYELRSLLDAGAVKVVDGSSKPVKVVDSSWALDGTDMHALYLKDHIPGAVFFDIDAISDSSIPLPHMAPTPATFAEAVGAMGISADDHVVIYDRQGLFSAARVWWTFKLMGHQNVQVLSGGLPAWTAAGFPLETMVPTPVPTTYLPRYKADMVIDLNALQENIKAKNPPIILDARPRARFEGTAPEPRAGLRSGHMPGARSLPFAELIQDGTLKPKTELKAIFSRLGVFPGQPVVTTCGSGVTAAIISMALDEVGHTPAILYDGSWSEWGQVHLATQVVTGTG